MPNKFNRIRVPTNASVTPIPQRPAYTGDGPIHQEQQPTNYKGVTPISQIQNQALGFCDSKGFTSCEPNMSCVGEINSRICKYNSNIPIPQNNPNLCVSNLFSSSGTSYWCA